LPPETNWFWLVGKGLNGNVAMPFFPRGKKKKERREPICLRDRQEEGRDPWIPRRRKKRKEKGLAWEASDERGVCFTCQPGGGGEGQLRIPPLGKGNPKKGIQLPFCREGGGKRRKKKKKDGRTLLEAPNPPGSKKISWCSQKS